MTYTESAALMQDVEFRGRIKVAALKYADSILNEATSTPASNTRRHWALGTQQQPDNTALLLQPSVVMDAAVQAAGAAIADAGLQGAVETCVNRQF
jgi:hypothetical protein